MRAHFDIILCICKLCAYAQRATQRPANQSCFVHVCVCVFASASLASARVRPYINEIKFKWAICILIRRRCWRSARVQQSTHYSMGMCSKRTINSMPNDEPQTERSVLVLVRCTVGGEEQQRRTLLAVSIVPHTHTTLNPESNAR